MGELPEIRIEAATEADVALVHDMIESLADHLGLAHEVVATEADLHDALFGRRPKAEVVIAYADGDPAGFALFYDNYSTFRGRCGIHLEDLYVRGNWRGAGIGRYLLAYLADLTRQRGCSRLEWWVLSSDEGAVGFYEAIGATAKGEWDIYRLQGKALDALADEVHSR
ncbi:MAG: GNAT family N-acetyltransferase [Gammaproteobacteria bacterium]